jgi:hypothetical protein
MEGSRGYFWKRASLPIFFPVMARARLMAQGLCRSRPNDMSCLQRQALVKVQALVPPWVPVFLCNRQDDPDYRQRAVTIWMLVWVRAWVPPWVPVF